ncbi:hypothetical protein BDV96DRAFT_567151 [Lophiotrema nucula]|uniref:Uncharacterized protein n=1 Tax=Lophiotrema nucula TaxID=690887 RepID=A0A6A5ZNF4_9PLEO|nr:hypothetical protein BDV96DRAFT_567151 [Lophiotrema nucula]
MLVLQPLAYLRLACAVSLPFVCSSISKLVSGSGDCGLRTRSWGSELIVYNRLMRRYGRPLHKANGEFELAFRPTSPGIHPTHGIRLTLSLYLLRPLRTFPLFQPCNYASHRPSPMWQLQHNHNAAIADLRIAILIYSKPPRHRLGRLLASLLDVESDLAPAARPRRASTSKCRVIVLTSDRPAISLPS